MKIESVCYLPRRWRRTQGDHPWLRSRAASRSCWFAIVFPDHFQIIFDPAGYRSRFPIYNFFAFIRLVYLASLSLLGGLLHIILHRSFHRYVPMLTLFRRRVLVLGYSGGHRSFIAGGYSRQCLRYCLILISALRPSVPKPTTSATSSNGTIATHP